jgi:hypothetical protein
MTTSFGGAAAKRGIRYEALWTIAKIAELLGDGSGSIHIEPPEADGIEFELLRGGMASYHQCKTCSTEDKWTSKMLYTRKVLASIWSRLTGNDAEFWFVSNIPASVIGDVADSTRNSTSFDSYNREITGKPLRGHFDSLVRDWKGTDCDDTETRQLGVFDRLRRTHARCIGFEDLADLARSKLAAHGYDGDAALRSLLDFVLGEGVGRAYTACEIHQWLVSRGVAIADWAKDRNVIEGIAAVNGRFIRRLEAELLLGKAFTRPEVDSLFETLTNAGTRRGSMVVGEAGVGKSSIVLQVTKRLQASGIPVIAFGADQLRVGTTTALGAGQDLGLPASPVYILARMSPERSVLVLDQVDAVSLFSGRASDRFEAISELVRQAMDRPGVRLLLACRRLDVDNDHRLKRLVGKDGSLEESEVRPINPDRVREFVTALRLDPQRLDQSQVRLLSLPLHLRLLADVVADGSHDALDFSTEIDLYDAFWDWKRRRCQARMGGAETHWTETFDVLLRHMTEHESVSAPVSIVDAYQSSAESMASEHVLVRDRAEYRFFHEGFLDYVFARRFHSLSPSVAAFLIRSEQTLSKRAQVRQVLQYLRAKRDPEYTHELRTLLGAAGVRAHIRQLVLAWLRGLADPTMDEWLVAEPLLTRDDYLAGEAWDFLYSAAWFDLLDREGRLAGWLASDGAVVDECFRRVQALERIRPSTVARLLAPYATTGGPWRERMRLWAYHPLLDGDHGLVEIYARLIRGGLLDSKQQGIGGHFWSALLHLAEKQPKWACELVGGYLNRKLELAEAAGVSSPFDEAANMIPDHGSDDHVLGACAQRAPDEFLSQVWPFITATVMRNAAPADGSARTDEVWFRYRGGLRISVRDCLLDATADALALVAERNVSAFRTLAQQVRADDYETMQYLLLHAYASNASLYADEAVEYLCERPCRMHTDSSQHYEVVRNVLRNVTPHCTEGNLHKLEEAIASFAPDSEGEYGAEGYGRFLLLDAVTPDRRTAAMTEMHSMLSSKFGPVSKSESERYAVFATRIGPPIPENDIPGLTDEQWLDAVASFGSDDLGHDQLGRTIGGAGQMASALDEQTKKNPSRFAKLALRLPEDANPCYFTAVLRGIAGSSLDVKEITPVCLKCHSLPSRPCGREISDLIGKSADKDIGEELIAMVGWYATEGAAPGSFYAEHARSAKDEEVALGLWTDGMNSVRGAASEAVAQLIWHDQNRMPLLRPFITKMVEDPSAAVRTCVARVVLLMLKHNDLRHEAVTLFQHLCGHPDDVLLATRPVAEVITYTCHDMSNELEDIVARMVDSQSSEVQTAGARAVAIMTLTLGRVHELTERCFSGSRWHQLGSAQVYAYNLSTPQTRIACSDALRRLFESPYEDVRKQAASCFEGFEGTDMSKVQDLALALVASAAFQGEEGDLLHALKRSTAEMPGLVLRACERFLDRVGATLTDMRTSAAAQARTVLELIIRAYHQSGDDLSLRTKALDLLDRLVELGVRLPDDVVAPD